MQKLQHQEFHWKVSLIKQGRRSPAGWIFLEFGAFFFLQPYSDICTERLFLCGLSVEVAVVRSQGFQQRVVKYTEKVHIESCPSVVSSVSSLATDLEVRNSCLNLA